MITAANEYTRAYQVLKASLGDYQLQPGRQIPVEIIAHRLGIGVSPVKEACSRLTSEGWAIPGTRTRYFAWRPDESAIAGLYDCNRAIIMSALDFASADSGKTETLIARLKHKLTHRELGNTTLAAYTGALFYAVVERAGKRSILEFVQATNERMYYLRVLECRHFVNVASELQVFCERLTGEDTHENREELREAVASYHDRRRLLVPELYGMLAAQ